MKLNYLIGFSILLISNAAYADNHYYFNHEPYINPHMIEDLTSWLSDGGDQIVEINLTESQNSNRYFMNKTHVQNIKGAFPRVRYWADSQLDQTYDHFGYQLIKAQPPYYFLRTDDSGGGTGTFESLLVVTFVCDKNINGTQRVLIKKLGEVYLGDRWGGKININGNQLTITTANMGSPATPQSPETTEHKTLYLPPIKDDCYNPVA